MNPYTFGMWLMVAFVAGMFGAAAIGAWLERRKQGGRPFVVKRNPKGVPFKVIDAEAIQLFPVSQDWDELERILLEEHQGQKSRRLN